MLQTGRALLQWRRTRGTLESTFEVSETQLRSLFLQLAEGERKAFEPAFALLWPRLRAFCTQMLRNEADADDASQLAICKVFEQVSAYDHERPAFSWAIAIASFECRTIVRKRSRRKEDALELSLGERIQDRAPTPEEFVSEKELRSSAEAALAALEPAEQKAIMSAFLEDAGPRSATERKQKERVLSRLRALWKRTYGS
jgi:RNA polymerase sigma-70 factor, ECF subfamily